MTEPPVKFPLSSRPILTPRQLAERWQCSAAHVVKLVNSGVLKGGRLGPRMVRIPIESVEEFERLNFVAQSTVKPRSAGVPVAPLDVPFYTVAEVAKRWGCSAYVVRCAIHSGELEGIRLGDRPFRITADKLAEHEIKRGSSPGRLGARVPREPTEQEVRRKEATKALRIVWDIQRARRRERDRS